MPSVNYEYGDEEHQRWKLASVRKGQTLKEWIRRALNQAADEQDAQRAEDERKRRAR